MKKNIHPENYREVAFKDITSGSIFIVKSTAETKETIEHNGKTYPLFNIDSSSASHSVYTGNRTMQKSTGQIEKFNRRLGKK